MAGQNGLLSTRGEELWNEISRVFVESYKGAVVQIYFRTLSDTSVLMEKEVPNNIESYNVGFDTVDKAGKALKLMLDSKPYSFNEHAYRSANSQFFDKNRAPFALYG